jgi:hypothetical protein
MQENIIEPDIQEAKAVFDDQIGSLHDSNNKLFSIIGSWEEAIQPSTFSLWFHKD